MGVETELKLRIAPEQLARLKRHVLLKTHLLTRPVTPRLYNIYCDTSNLALHDSGMALHLRHAGRQWLQTLKGGGSVQAGMHQRNEWEVAVSGPALDFDVLEVAEWKANLPSSLRNKLQPVFVTDFSRSSRMLLWQGAQIELCMDQGEVSAGQRSTPICELELELKSGDPRQLFELALVILDVVPFESEVVSKAEYGYRLLSDFAMHPVNAGVVNISGTARLADMLKTLIWGCLQHFQNNLRGAMDSNDAEYLHQMRVALRRLRVVLHMAEKLHSDKILVELRRDISVLCVSLGRIREWDVFIAGTLQPMCKRMNDHAGLQVLLAAGERQRDSCYAALRDASQALELQRLLLRFAIWMNGDYWLQAGTGATAQQFATRYLRKLAKQFARFDLNLETFDTAHLHQLRIVAKKLRYSAEFFAVVYDKKKAGGFLAVLGRVQDLLGQMNDVAVAHRLLDELVSNVVLFAHQERIIVEAVNLSRGWIAHDLDDQLGILRKTIQRFNHQAAFWEK